MIALQVGALVLGVLAVALLWVLDRPEDLGSVSGGWLRRDREGRQ